jgi:DNA-binding NtrC family response regulator
MIDSTILTITTNKEFLSLLRRELQNQVGIGSRMIVAGTIEEACALLEMARPRIVIVHCTGESARYEQLDQLLWTTTVLARPIPVLVIADRYRTDQATTLFRMGVSEYISRTHHLDQLGQVFAAYLPHLPRHAEHAPAGTDLAEEHTPTDTDLAHEHTPAGTDPAVEPAKTRMLTQPSRASVSQVL